ncbi:DUF4265 domain-containing protein [Bradyrhizobium cenepequi]|uniref:DUF4265 domain-containing protein n=1 Tax=Bradyrhizobium cenepequi TaxID=2821403 RepID=UPI001CE28FE8|nr:DUF4265 domain-containing protein [Bradyrhizobium cenepequi]MCA6111923.1 DUF4265 domain-containing protein [Bradyrhizobium cenepequi]
MSDQLVKVRFKLDAEDWHGHGGEKLWAAKLDTGLLEIKNTPFFKQGISYCDVVKASPSDDPMQFDFESVVERGHHSTYMILIDPTESRRGQYWKRLENAGCTCESGQIKLSIGERLIFAVDVSPTADLNEVNNVLRSGHEDGVWIYQVGYVSSHDASKATQKLS